ncbi:unnamed protein product [Linum tenue]|uniref:HTH myb-type domain-containing protein n=1 Tax=Linum tenue TaxID=586396 RepID=A0AAV0R5J8_9ROSI|nr:unnamed protein product [Linum tenue]
MDFPDQRKRCHEYVDALEEERRKIQVFQRELPLCLELVTQAIEACRRELSGSTPTEYTTTMPGQSDCSEQTSSGGGPVLEEFIPIKPHNNSSSCDDDENENENHHNTHRHDEEDHEIQDIGSVGDERSLKRNRSENQETEDHKSSSGNKKSEWLRSVQLWNQSPDPPPPNEEVPRRAVVKEVKRSGSGGAFQPFQKEKNSGGGVGKSNGGCGGGNHDKTTAVATAAATTPSSVLSSSAAAAGTSGGGDGDPSVSNKNSNKQQQQKDVDNKEAQAQQRKQRRCWSPELHRRFLHALQQLGGSHAATPKQIRELMKVDGLTNDEVKSHLQKYRLHTRRPSHGVQNTSNQPGPQFVVVGGIWVPPSAEYAAAATTAVGETANIPAAAGQGGSIYAPVATTVGAQKQQASSTEQLQSEGRGSSRSEGGGPHHPCSPSTCSSTRTATSSPGI